MSRVTPQSRSLATRVITYEARATSPPSAKAVTAYQACDRLRSPLMSLVGSGGFHAIHSRALHLATLEIPALGTVRMSADGTLQGLEKLRGELDPGDFSEGGIVLLAQLLGLLIALIGEPMTLRLVREAWPRMPLRESNAAKRDRK